MKIASMLGIKWCLTPIIRLGLGLMSRWGRILCTTVLLTGLNNVALAICEKEIEQVVSDSYNREGTKPVVSRDQLLVNARKVIQFYAAIQGQQRQALIDDKRRTLELDKTLIARTNSGEHRYGLSNTLMDLCALGEVSKQSIGNSPASNQSTQQRQQQQPQQNQSAQQQSQQAQQQAQQNQARADQARQGKRKTHDAAAEAHQCIAIDNAGSGNFGAFKNTCSYKVNFDTCNYKPRITQGGFNWSADFNCEKQQIGMHTPGAGVSVAAHNRNTEMVYWFACKAPATPVDVTYVQGQGLSGRCN